MGSRVLTENDKEICIEEHFVYEVNMLIYSFGQISKFLCDIGRDLSVTDVSTPSIPGAWGQPVDKNLGNMAQEVFLLHARNLREFFYAGASREDDVRASDFFAGTESWDKIAPTETASIQEVKKRADKELAHVTTKRISGTPPEKYWSHGQIFSDFVEVIGIFTEKLSQKYIGENLSNIRDQMAPYRKASKALTGYTGPGPTGYTGPGNP